MKKFFPIILLGLAIPLISFALPYYSQTNGLIPGTTNTYYIGTSSPSTLEYKGIFVKDIVISGTCTGCGVGGGSFPFTSAAYGVSTSTIVGFLGGMFAVGSSTIQDLHATNLTFSALTSGGLAVNSSGLVYKAATTTFTGSTGLTYSNGNVTCDVATGSVPGCLAAADWTSFNAKAGFGYPFTNGSDFFATTTGGVFTASTTVQQLHATTFQFGLSSGIMGLNGGSAYAIATTSLNASITGSAGSVANSATFNSSGGAAANSTFNGSAALTVDYHTVGAQQVFGTLNGGVASNGTSIYAFSTSTMFFPLGAGSLAQNSVGTLYASATTTAGNPSGTVGLSATNGVATTYMRSDGIPALSQSILPTWTGLHIFSANASTTVLSSLGSVFVGRTATTTINGDNATSTFSSDVKIKLSSANALNIQDAFGTQVLNVYTASSSGTTLFAVFATTSAAGSLCGGSGITCLFSVDGFGHVAASSTVPTLSSCGTSPSLSADSNDLYGTITVGSVATACTLTFGKAHAIGTHCVISEQTGSVTNVASYTESLTGFVYSQTALSSNVLDYFCSGQ